MNKCPKCENELLPFEYHALELLKCSNCHGFWFKDGKFRAVKQVGFSGLAADFPSESSSEPSSELSSEQDLICPDCEELLLPFTYAYNSDVQLHRCTSCHGIWADASDLFRIEELLAVYKESLDEAKAKALPLMLNVKKQIQQEERTREKEQKQKKKPGLLGRFFGSKHSNDRKVQNIFDDIEKDDNEDA